MPASRSSTVTGSAGAWAGRLLRARWFVRAPIGLYRARLGFVFGSSLLMLEHTGRKSGARRRVVLEVVDRPGPGTYVVASGFGDRAQWFRNVRANPRVRVHVAGRAPATATARLLTGEEAAAALARYEGRHPRAAAALKPVLEQAVGAPLGSLPMVAFDLQSAGKRP